MEKVMPHGRAYLKSCVTHHRDQNYQTLSHGSLSSGTRRVFDCMQAMSLKRLMTEKKAGNRDCVREY